MLKANLKKMTADEFAAKWGFKYHRYDGPSNARYVENSCYGSPQMSFDVRGQFDDCFSGCGDKLYEMIACGDVVMEKKQ